ncbi:sugar ABC transporter substrate-binding protein [Tessaracoccus sp. Z1128]
MKQGIKLVGLLAAGALALSACGTTASTPTSSAPAGESSAPAASAGATVTFAPSEVVKPNDGATLKIGVTFPILDQFLQKVADGIEARAEEAGVEVTIVSAQEKADVQLGQVENFISQGVDGIIIIPVDTDAAGPMTQKAQDAEIPLAYVNRRPADLPAGVTYVGSDSLVSGLLEMEALAELADGKGKVGIIQGDPANEAARLRTQGCKDVVAKYPDMEVVREQAGNWYREEGLAITENWIQSGDEIDIICANNDEMALGAIQALKNAGTLDDVLVGGVDATADALAAMEAGELEVTVFQDAAGQGAGGVDAIVTMYNGDEVPAVIDVPYQLVTPDNMADFK